MQADKCGIERMGGFHIRRKAEGNLAKAAYSQEEGRVMTLKMLKSCPMNKLEEAIEECEFYLEPGRLYVKLPYWNNNLLNRGWISNGEGKMWKNWLVIRIEDIENFLIETPW